MTLIDSHMHVWRAAEGPTPDVTTIVPPQQDVPIDLARAAMDSAGVERAVLVQPIFRADDNSYVAACARTEPKRFAAVCVIDPRAFDAAAQLEHWIGQGYRGVRLRSGPNCDMGRLDDPALDRLFEAAERLRAVVSLLIGPADHENVIRRAKQFPRLAFVLDHMGCWGTSGGETANLAALQPRTADNLYVKLSGFHHLTQSPFPYRDWFGALRWFIDEFGPKRLMIGSDYPHSTVASSYSNSLHVLDQALPNLPTNDRHWVTAGSAASLYWPDVLD